MSGFFNVIIKRICHWLRYIITDFFGLFKLFSLFYRKLKRSRYEYNQITCLKK